FAKSEFVGYETTKISTKIIKIFPDGIVLEKTPFYATSGGQVSDTGTIGNNDFSLSVTDVSKLPNGQFIHAFDTIFGTPSEGTEVYAAIDETRREEIARHHSATHLLFKALRDVLGDHVSQQGSQVSEESLRFDFNHYEMPTDEEILKVESIVRKMISESHKAHTDIVTVEEAVKKGAIAEFGEKYGDNVRMVNLYYTLDLCGGTHVKDIADIGNFAIKSIFSIGSGIYRIEALADKAVSRLPEAYANIDIELMNIKDRIAEILKSAKSEGLKIEYVEPVFPQLEGGYRDILAKREEFRLMQEKIKEMDKEYQRLLYDKKAIDIAPYLKLAKNNRVVAEIKGASIDQLKQLADNLSNNLENGFVMLASLIDADKIMFVAKSKNKNLHAGNLVKKAAQICGGNGGGRPDFAQAGGKDAEKLAEALDEVRKALL
ncbi:MAG TPA: DHHA1 domain-containing protein, partial [Bacillota bacterium]|nr:DHHA1 domain-containing protein [Bacillota bacterium]